MDRAASLAQAYAPVGRAEEVVREGDRAVKLQPVSMDAMEGPARLMELARIQAAAQAPLNGLRK